MPRDPAAERRELAARLTLAIERLEDWSSCVRSELCCEDDQERRVEEECEESTAAVREAIRRLEHG